MSDSEPESPCISVCVLDENDICVGCFRSADEISTGQHGGQPDPKRLVAFVRQTLNNNGRGVGLDDPAHVSSVRPVQVDGDARADLCRVAVDRLLAAQDESHGR